MFERSPKYAPVLLTLLLTASAACNRTDASPTTPAPSGGALKTSLTAEPQMLRPEFLAGSSCIGRSPFGVRINIVRGSGEDVILRGLHFSFIDRLGQRALPEVFPLAEGSILPSSSPVTLPTRGPIPIAGSPPNDTALFTGLASRELFFLRFSCGVVPGGTLAIIGDFIDRGGRSNRAELRVAVSE